MKTKSSDSNDETNLQLEGRSLLHDLLNSTHSEDELRNLCFHMGVDYDNLVGQNKTGRIREFILHCQRHNHIRPMLNKLYQLRPELESIISARELYTRLVRKFDANTLFLTEGPLLTYHSVQKYPAGWTEITISSSQPKQHNIYDNLTSISLSVAAVNYKTDNRQWLSMTVSLSPGFNFRYVVHEMDDFNLVDFLQGRENQCGLTDSSTDVHTDTSILMWKQNDQIVLSIGAGLRSNVSMSTRLRLDKKATEGLADYLESIGFKPKA